MSEAGSCDRSTELPVQSCWYATLPFEVVELASVNFRAGRLEPPVHAQQSSSLLDLHL